jgi:hypothetical protein
MVYQKIQFEEFSELNKNTSTAYKNFNKRYNKFIKITRKNLNSVSGKYYYDEQTYNLINDEIVILNKILNKKYIKENIFITKIVHCSTSSDGGLEWDDYFKMDYKEFLNDVEKSKNYLDSIIQNRISKDEYDKLQEKKEKEKKMFERLQKVPERYRKRLL